MSQPSVLIVTTDQEFSRRRCLLLREAGFQPIGVSDYTHAQRLLERRSLALVIVQGGAEMRQWRQLAQLPAAPPLVLLAPRPTVDEAKQALRAGAAEYLSEGCSSLELVNTVRRLVGREQDLVARDPRSREVYRMARRVAQKDVSVLITGESGTGKEMLARHIHEHSGRAEGPFVAVNCAAIPEQMIEAVLFGFEKGAFTGAHRSHAGKFEQAQGGTLLLDEISEIDAGLQAKLLRVLQEREIERLCGSDSIPLDVRVLASSNRDLRQEVAAGRFRADLYYRLHVFPVHLPPLRERLDDVLPLAEAFIAKHAGLGPEGVELDETARGRLLGHDWPGNVRELENVIQRAMILADEARISADDLVIEPVPAAPATRTVAPAETADGAPEPTPAGGRVNGAHRSEAEGAATLGDNLREREFRLIMDTLRACRGNRKRAAEKLGISDRTLRYRVARLRKEGFHVPSKAGAEYAYGNL